MLISKQEFNKLSKRDQDRLIGTRKQKQKRTSKKQTRSPKNQLPKTFGKSGKATTVAPIASATRFAQKKPQVSSTADSCHIRHRELISLVVGTDPYNVSTVPINPGLKSSFPWLSLMAQGWEEYAFNSLKFIYVSRTNSVTVGSFMMAFDYDAADAAPQTEEIITNYAGMVDNMPWVNFECHAQKNSLNGFVKRHYLRTGPVSPNLDIKTYDVANFFFATSAGGPDSPLNWGKLYVEYDVNFYIPQLPSTGVPPFGGSIVAGGGGITPAVPFGPAPQVNPSASGISMGTDSTLTLLNPGSYVLSYQFEGTGLTAPPGPTYDPAFITIISNDAVVSADGANAQAYANFVVLKENATFKQVAAGTSLDNAGLNIGQAPNGSLD